MRILFTGMQRRQVSEDTTTLNKDYTPSERPIIDALRALGHEVTLDKPAVGDRSLRDRYDLAFVGLSGYHQLSSFGHRFHALWAVSQLPHVTFIGDWQLHHICRALQEPESSLWSMPHTNCERGDEVNYREIHVAAASLIRMRKLLLPTHWWGDAECYRTRHKAVGEIIPWDPSPHVSLSWDEPGSFPQSRRRDAWICVSLSPMEKRLSRMGLSWPVEGRWEKTQEYIPERVLIDVTFREYAATLSPSRRHGNCVPGLFRIRNLFHAARLIPSASDTFEMGRISHVFPPAGAIEDMSPPQRDALACAQRDAMLSGMLTVGESLSRLEVAIKAATMPPAEA